MTVKVTIVSAEEELYSGEAAMVLAPSVMGEIGITPGHMALISNLQPGEVRIKQDDGSEESLYVSGGIIEVQPHIVTILSDTAKRAADLDEAKAQQAMDAAQRVLENQDSDMDLAQARAEIAQAAAQLHLIRKLRGKN